MVDLTEYATLDFETYYDKEFSLSKLQTDAYVLDPRFELIMVGVRARPDAEVEWHATTSTADMAAFLADRIDWPNTAVCAHNALFDGFICTQLLGLKPKLWLDTVAMGRTLYPRLVSHSLGALAKHFGVGKKGNEVVAALGKRLADFTPQELEQYAGYCMTDVALTDMLCRIMLPDLPAFEIGLIDMTTRMFTEPTFVGDREVLVKHYHEEVERKEELLEQADVHRDIIMSNERFAEELRARGVVPPTKVSPTTGKTAYAFAKTDKALTALQDSEDSEVQALVAARLGVKTTIAETRAKRMVETCERGEGRIPVFLRHWGAKTTGRLSGGNQMNFQNVPARGPSAVLRYGMVAPPGHKVVVGDSSNIELRVALAVAGEREALRKIADGLDMYCDFASERYGREITKADKYERLLGKVAMLSCQYGTGADRFREMARIMGLDLSPEEAQDIINFYRAKFRRLKNLWYYCQETVLPAIYNRDMVPVDVNGWCLTTGEGFSLPGYPGVQYSGLDRGSDGEWVYYNGKKPVRIYGPKVVENLCQHLARQIVMWQTLRVHRVFPVALSVHDEIACIVPDEKAEHCRVYMEESFSMTPRWCRGEIPLQGEAGIGLSYGDAKPD